MHARWTSIFFRWHLQNVVVVWVVARIAATGMLFVPGAPGPPPSINELTGLDVAMISSSITVVLSAVDRHRRGVNLLFENIGVSRTSLIMTSFLLPYALEMLLWGALAQ